MNRAELRYGVDKGAWASCDPHNRDGSSCLGSATWDRAAARAVAPPAVKLVVSLLPIFCRNGRPVDPFRRGVVQADFQHFRLDQHLRGHRFAQLIQIYRQPSCAAAARNATTETMPACLLRRNSPARLFLVGAAGSIRCGLIGVGRQGIDLQNGLRRSRQRRLCRRSCRNRHSPRQERQASSCIGSATRRPALPRSAAWLQACARSAAAPGAPPTP